MNYKRVSVLLLALLVGAVGYGLQGCARKKQADGEKGAAAEAPEGKRRVPVVLTPVSSRTFEERIVVQGTLKAKNFAIVSARVPGIIEHIYVDEGDEVVAGKTKLFQIDSVKLRKAVEIKSQGLAVAKVAVREKQANLERVEADFQKAELDYERFKRLRAQDAVTLDAFENQESRYKQARAMLKHARTLIDLSAEQKKQAEGALVIAEKDLQDSLVYAPINGTVSQRIHEPGEMGTIGGAIIKIEDTTVLEAAAFLPAQFYAQVHTNTTSVEISVYGIQIPSQLIAYKSPTISPTMPTFEVKTVLHDPPEGVVPNAMAQVTVLLEHHDGLGVPASAVQIRDDTPVVFLAKKGIAHMIQVVTASETDGWVQILGGNLPEGSPVVSMGQFLLSEGTLVAVQEGGT